MKNINNTKSNIFVAGACGMSSIQREMHRETLTQRYINECERLTNEYVVPCSVFTFNGMSITEAVKGYFVGESGNKDSIKKCKDAMLSLSSPAILMTESRGTQLYQVGVLYESLSQIPTEVSRDAIFNIRSKSYLE